MALTAVIFIQHSASAGVPLDPVRWKLVLQHPPWQKAMTWQSQQATGISREGGRVESSTARRISSGVAEEPSMIASSG